ncbi:MAG: LysM peptidoglycan-binding domain-containing protein [Bacilli bacterium]|nr:LysM peptidoglycan-binding domain-containing protein [Bacilli bacterium]
MEKIVPFKKNIEFDDNIYEISSISLEHTLSLKDENLISGNFIISGSYLMSEKDASPVDFKYNIPFEIRIDNKYDTSAVSADINNFYYEIVDSKILSVNIDVILENLEKREILQEERGEDLSKEKLKDKEDERDIVNINEENSPFKLLDDKENYVTYKIHIVTENDTTQSILEQYEVTLSDLEKYNDLSELKIGDKVIIPNNE